MPPRPAELESESAVREDENASRIHAAFVKDGERLRRAIAVHIVGLRLALPRDLLRERANDVWVETYARALKTARTLDPDREAYPWIKGIALNVLLEKGREWGRNIPSIAATDLGENWDGILAKLSCGSSDHAVAQRMDVQRTLERLAPGPRHVLELHVSQGLDGEELAQALGVSKGTARVRLHRARQRFAEVHIRTTGEAQS